MLFWILACLVLWLVYIYTPATLNFRHDSVENLVGSRDANVPPSAMTARARRAQANFGENLPFFLTLAILALVLSPAKMDLAVMGAAVFVLARVAYLPLYLVAIPMLRSLAYGVSMVGLGMMAFALLT
jgi:uncharacterized MAPEG superfamily protein